MNAILLAGATSRRASTFLLSAGVLLAGGLAAHGQAPAREQMIPAELLAAVLNTYPGGFEPRVITGSIPAELTDATVVPTGGRVVGTVLLPYASIVAVAIPDTADRIRAAATRALKARGWHELTIRERIGGFQTREERSAMSWCANGRNVRTMIRDRAAGGALLTFVIATPGFDVPCAPDGTPVAAPSGRGILPLLYDPEGVKHEATVCQRVNSGRLGNRSSTHFTSSMSPTALLEHYGRQLADSGWRAAPTSGPGTSITRSWTRVDSAGQRVTARLTIVVPSDHPECRELELHLEERW